MDGASRSSRSKQPLLKYKWVPRDIAYFDAIEIVGEENIPGVSKLHNQGLGCHSESKPYDQIISTNKLISSFSCFCETISQRLSVLQSRNVIRYNHHANVTHPSNVEKLLLDASANISEFQQICDTLIGPNEPTTATQVVSSVPSITLASYFLNRNGSGFSCQRETRGSMLSSMGIEHNSNSICRKIRSDSLLLQSSKDCGLTTPGFSCDLVRMYGLVSNFPFFGSKHLTNGTLVNREANNHKTRKVSPEELEGGSSVIKPGHLPTLPDPFQCSSASRTLELNINVSTSKASLSEVYFIGETENLEGLSSVSELSGPSLLSDHYIKLSTTDSDQQTCKQPHSSCQEVIESLGVVHCSDRKNNVLVNNREYLSGEVMKNDLSRLFHLSMHKRLNYSPANEGYALAGALAGIFVSLWLHPIDTVKTVIQSHRMDQRSISHVLGTILSEKGVAGLYRGIGSNLVSSAPISAVYTFTYEAVKGALLPLLPKEYHSFAHCTAGGCASIATSFIFTPSERIKQQMQVGSPYQNCWNALIGIIEKGGLASLYAGWGAVLCRNIPHSIIKFYTYESLKQWAFLSNQNCLHPSTLQTLICGGLACSTAALFTTPFDVIKTRLQTQMPGSLKIYDGVFHAFREIANKEGLRGFYRGLTPRLIMYMSQGAIFFASYEFLKRLFSLGVQKTDEQNPIAR